MGIDTFLGVDFLKKPYILPGNVKELLFFTHKLGVENVLFSFITCILMLKDLDSFLYFT